jgi:hypothetical protein
MSIRTDSKLFTPAGVLTFVVVGGSFLVWYFDVDVWEHLQGIRETIHHVTAGIL